MKTYVFINGILNMPGSAKNWTGRAVTWSHVNDPQCQAEKVEYWCTPIGRVFGQTGREHKLFATLSRYSDPAREIRLVGHSNGCAVIVQGMQRHPGFPRIAHLHLVCGACEASFRANGLNTFLAKNRIGLVTCYLGGEDWALRLARCHPARWLGYGTLGYSGPLDVDTDVKDRVRVVSGDPWQWYGHGECWQDDNFDETMRNFTQGT